MAGTRFTKIRMVAPSTGRYRNPSVKPAWYKARQRSVTPAQKAAERALWPLFGLTFSHNMQIDLDAAFGGAAAPTTLEIGCGSGEALVQLAEARPEANFVGVDWYRSGLATCCKEVQRHGLENVRLVRADALLLLERGLPAAPLFDEVLIYFPDPWRGSPERRMVRPDVLSGLTRRMRPSGILHVATDVDGYPQQVRDVLAAPAFASSWRPVSCADRWRPNTKYERDGLAAGREVTDLCYVYEGE